MTSTITNGNPRLPNPKSKIANRQCNGGEGGIRTLGSLLGYGALAKRCFRPLSHLTKIVATVLWAVAARATGAWLQTRVENIVENCRLPTPTLVACSRFHRSCQLPIAN